MISGSDRRHVIRLARYVLSERAMLSLTIIAGTLGFVVTFVYPWLIGRLIDEVMIPATTVGADAASWDRLVELTLLGLGAAFIFAISGYGRGHFSLKLGNRIVTRIRVDLFEHLQRLSLHFYARQRSGLLVSQIIHEVHGVNGLIYHGFVVVFLDVLQLAIAVTLLYKISPALTATVLVVLPLYVITFKVFNPLVRKASEQVHEHFGVLCGNTQEVFANVALVKAYAAEKREKERFSNEVTHHYGLVVRQSHVGHLMGASSELWVHFGTTLIIGLGGYLAISQPPGQALTAGQLTMFLGYVGILYGPIRRFADLNIVYQNSLAAMRRVFRIFEIKPHIAEHSNAVTHTPEHGLVEFDHVRFSYEQDSDEQRFSLDGHVPSAPDPDAARRYVLDGINFVIHPGERIALVGPSGSGKTTLASLLARLYDVNEGAIRVDGHDLRDYRLDALRRGIAVVQQESFIFSGSVRDNLLYGRPDATVEQVIEAAKAANAHEFILELPHGYDTRLGERGVNLSGGQKQRLSIARAILKDPRILILDEATSALDTQSERLVQQALDRLMVGRTCLIIAHRLSTVRHADRILVMQLGRIAETGTHDSLLAAGGLYASLVRQSAEPGHDGLRDTSARKKRRRRVRKVAAA